jgi:hypothetical protein
VLSKSTILSKIEKHQNNMFQWKHPNNRQLPAFPQLNFPSTFISRDGNTHKNDQVFSQNPILALNQKRKAMALNWGCSCLSVFPKRLGLGLGYLAIGG